VTDLAVSRVAVSAESFIDEWERQPGEPAKGFKAFTVFRDMGDDRGVIRVRDVAGGTYGHKQLMTWATTWRWVERANAYDRMLDRRRQAAHIAEVEAMARRQVQTGQVLQERGLRYVEEELDTAEQRKKNMTPNVALRFIDTGVNLEREGLGMDDKGGTGDTNITVNVMEAGAKADVFGKIDEMAANFAAMKEIIARGGVPEPTDIVDAEVVEDDQPSP
jgi:hypothetical protein